MLPPSRARRAMRWRSYRRMQARPGHFQLAWVAQKAKRIENALEIVVLAILFSLIH